MHFLNVDAAKPAMVKTRAYEIYGAKSLKAEKILVWMLL